MTPRVLSTVLIRPASPKMMRNAKARRISLIQYGTTSDSASRRAQLPVATLAM